MCGLVAMSIADFLGVELQEGALAYDVSPRPPRSDAVQPASASRLTYLVDDRGTERAVLGDSPENTFLTIRVRPRDPPFEVEIMGEAKRLKFRSQDLTVALETAGMRRILVARPLCRKYADLAFDDGEHIFYFGLIEVVPSI